MKTQYQMYYESLRKEAEKDKTFLELISLGMTNKELEKNIEKRPGLWGKYKNFIGRLKN